MAFREIDDDLWDIVQKYPPPTKPHIVRPRCDPRVLINGILYVLTTGCSWLDVPANYGTKSTVHRYHLKLLRERSVPGDPSRLAPIRVRDQKNRSLSLCDGYQGYLGEKRGSTGYDGYKKVKGNKLSVLVDRNGLPLACTVAPANTYDSRLYEPTLEGFEIPDMPVRPTIISADAAYDAREIRQYNRNRGMKSNIPVNRRSRKQPKRGRPVWFDPEFYKKHSAVERFFSWIEAFKKSAPRYERYEHSFMGLIHLECSVMIGRILG